MSFDTKHTMDILCDAANEAEIAGDELFSGADFTTVLAHINAAMDALTAAKQDIEAEKP